jgi:hypothetical protein
MVMYLTRIDQVFKIRDDLFFFKKTRIFWILEVDCLFNGVKILRIKVAPKLDVSVWKASFLILYSSYKRLNCAQNLTMLDEPW